MRVRHEAHVEEQICLERDAVLVAEADEVHAERARARVPPEAVHHERFDLMDRVLRGLDHDVGKIPYLAQQLSLEAYRFLQRAFAAAERMRAASLAESPHEHRVARLQV